MRKSIDADGHKALIELIISKRIAAGMTQEDLAIALGQTQPWIAHLESKQRRVDVLEYVTLAKVLRFEPADELRKLIAEVNMVLLDV